MKKVVIEILEPTVKAHQKYDEAVMVLGKALGIEPHDHDEENTEPTPYPALQDLSDLIRGQAGAGLRRLFEMIVRTWLRAEVTKSWEPDPGIEEFCKALPSDPFTLNGRTYINPQTGAALTVKEWKAIAKDLDSVFGYLFGQTEQMLVLRAAALGKILQGMPVDGQLTTPYGDIIDQVATASAAIQDDPVYENQMRFAEVHTGELIQDMTTSARRRVVEVINDAQKNKLGTRETEDKLFEAFSTLNRDWRRIAETESATNFNNGFLLAELEGAEPGETIFMEGVSGAGACSFCATQVDGTVVVLLEGPPAGGDTVVVDGKAYPAIWPGKTNFGRKRKEWWLAAGTQHPHCLCTWVRWSPSREKYAARYRDAMARRQAGDLTAVT